MTEPAHDHHAANLALYEKLVATHPEIERKGATMQYTSINGHTFSFLTREGVVALRLPAGERLVFLEAFQTRPCVQYVRVLKEYVEVPQALLEETADLKTFFDTSVAYVSGLKPRPTKRKNRS